MKTRKRVICSAVRHLLLFCTHTLDRPSSSLTRMKKEHYKSSCLQGRQQNSMEIIMTKLSSSINSEAGHDEGNQVNNPVCVKKINARLNSPAPAFCSSSRAFFSVITELAPVFEPLWHDDSSPNDEHIIGVGHFQIAKSCQLQKKTTGWQVSTISAIQAEHVLIDIIKVLNSI